jgi:DNA-binding NarL/FixJ family response regulator
LVGPLAVKLRRLLQERDLEPNLASLTEREREVLAFVGEGASNRQIAHQLNIAESIVKNQLRNILQKFHCANRVQAAAYAIRQGLVKEPQ